MRDRLMNASLGFCLSLFDRAFQDDLRHSARGESACPSLVPSLLQIDPALVQRHSQMDALHMYYPVCTRTNSSHQQYVPNYTTLYSSTERMLSTL